MNFFEKIWGWVTTFFLVLASWLRTVVVEFFGWIATAGEIVIDTLLTSVDFYFPSLDLSSLQPTLDKINYFFPLNEGVTLALSVFAVWCVVWVYKAVKSWVPTVSS